MNQTIKEAVFSSLKLGVFTLWKLKLDYILSILFGIIIIAYNKNEITWKKQKIAILAIERRIFNDDIKALNDFPSDYIILRYPFILWGLLSDDKVDVWPEELKEQVAFYSKKDKYPKFFDRLSKIFYNTLNVITAITKIDLKIILAANINYFQDYPWIKAIRKKNGKFIAIEKESIFFLSKSVKKIIITQHKKHNFLYEGDAVLFYNEIAKNAYVKTGGVKPDQAFVIGCPRVDRLISLAKNKVKQKDNFVLTASFITSFEAPIKEAIKVWNEILEAIYEDELLRSKTIIKCKGAAEAKNITLKYPNLSAAFDSMENYFKKSPAIFVGFNSTACLDALVVGIPTVIPWWGNAKKAGTDALLGDHTSDFHLIAYDKDELIKILKKYVANDTKHPENIQTVWNNLPLRKIVEKGYSKIDGKNCQRFFDIVDKLISIDN